MACKQCGQERGHKKTCKFYQPGKVGKRPKVQVDCRGIGGCNGTGWRVRSGVRYRCRKCGGTGKVDKNP